MNSSASFYSQHDSAELDPEEIRRLVAKGKQMGLIKESPRSIVSSLQDDREPRVDRTRYKPPVGPAQPIEKDGTPAVRDVPEPPAEVALAQATELPPGLNAQWLDVTPAIAHRWLLNNVRNRKIDHDTIQAYARDMKNGEWQSTHQGVAFNDQDELIDGQHRLHAVIASGCTVSMLVTFGLPSVIEGKEVTPMDCVDRGRPRSVADQLKLQHGLSHGTAIAQVTMGIARLCYQKRTRRLSVGQTLEIFRAWQAPIEHVIRFRSKEPGLKAAGVLAAFAFALAADVRLKLMFDRLNNGKDLAPGSALHALRTFLVSDDAKLLNRGSDRALAELVLHAILLEIQGTEVHHLTLDPAGADHFRTQQPDRVATVSHLFTLPEE
jgi:hypothetical protein